MSITRRLAAWICFFFSLHTASAREGVHWPQFRGPSSSGVQEGYATPTVWNGETGENVLWKTSLPGLGHGSPVIWGDRVFVVTAVSSRGNVDLQIGIYGNINGVPTESSHQWKVYCLDKKTGRILWERTAHEGVPLIKRHIKATHANSTPAVDGRHVVVFFGSEGLYCYDMDGKLKWKKDFGVLDSGFFSAPTALSGHTAVWTGSRMIVWGGSTGGQYDPVTNSWTPTSTVNAPAARTSHTAVWTGNRMVVWGGNDGPGSSPANTGGRYDPLADSWTPTSVLEAPSERRLHTAVWTGSRMIVWGGDGPGENNVGGRYDPATDSWTPTVTANAPPGRYLHTAVWTGNLMLVWGGFGGTQYRDGWRYDPVLLIG